MKRNQLFLCVIILLLVSFLAPIAAFGTAMHFDLNWPKSPAPDLMGYRVYCSVKSGQYVFVGKTNSFSPKGPSSLIKTVSYRATSTSFQFDVPENTRVFFVITAFDKAGNESKPSNERSFFVLTRDPQPKTLIFKTIKDFLSVFIM